MKHLHQNLPSHDINACFDAIEQDLAALLLESTHIPHALLERHLEELVRITDAPDALRMHEHAHSMTSFLATHGNRPFDADDRTQLSILLGHMRRLIRPWDNPANSEQALLQQPIHESAGAANRPIALWIDSKAMAEMMRAALAAGGYRCVDIAALDTLASWPDADLPAVIVADFALLSATPDAQTRLQQLRARAPGCALVCLSSRQDFVTQLAAVRLGASRLLPKPLDPKRLRVVIDSLCRHGGEGALRALLIDDNRTATAVNAAVLRQSNVQVEVCHFPHLAIDLVDAFRPDIIVCDIYMPGCNGLELAAVLQQDDRYAQIPLLFLSTENDINTQLEAMDLGADGFLTKPIKPDILCTLVKAKARRGRFLRRIQREACHLCVPDQK